MRSSTKKLLKKHPSQWSNDEWIRASNALKSQLLTPEDLSKLPLTSLVKEERCFWRGSAVQCPCARCSANPR